VYDEILKPENIKKNTRRVSSEILQNSTPKTTKQKIIY